MLKALAVQAPLMLMLDDCQWADTSSIQLLFHLVRRIAESPILFLGTYRPADVALGRNGEHHPLEQVLAEIKRYHGGILIDLEQTRQTEGQAFVAAFLDTEPNRPGADFSRALYQHTGGQPLFVFELLRAMHERGDSCQQIRRCTLSLPQRTRSSRGAKMRFASTLRGWHGGDTPVETREGTPPCLPNSGRETSEKRGFKPAARRCLTQRH